MPRHLQSSVLRFTERSVSTKCQCPVLVSNDPCPCWTFLKHIISWRVEAKQVRYAHWEAIHCKHLQTKLLWEQFYLFLRTKQTYFFNSVWTCETWTPTDQLVISVQLYQKLLPYTLRCTPRICQWSKTFSLIASARFLLSYNPLSISIPYNPSFPWICCNK